MWERTLSQKIVDKLCEQDVINTCDAAAYVYGYEGYHSNDGECCSSSYLFHEDISNYMRNFVKENGNDYATIKANLCDYEAASYSGIGVQII